MLITSSIPNLIGGVSQQPELLRLPSHLKEQVNCLSTPSRGLTCRFGTDHLGVVQANFTSYQEGGHTVVLDYGATGVYLLNTSPSGDVAMANAKTGENLPIYGPTGQLGSNIPYTSCANPADSIKVIKEADTTFLVNNAVVVAEQSAPAHASAWPALLWVKAGNYGRSYTVSVPGYGVYSYTTPDGGSASHSRLTNTTVIAMVLYELLGNTRPASGVTEDGGAWSGPGVAVPGVSLRGSVLSFTAGPAGTVVDDGTGGSGMSYVSHTVRSVGELPSRNAAPGFFVKVEGGDSSAAGDHYLQYNEAASSWEETQNPLEPVSGLNPDTLPVMIQPYRDGIQWRSCPWAGRKVGDSKSNPKPGFVGKRINDLFFFQDRMGLLSGEGCDISETSEYFNYYRTSVINLLDSDPVSVTVNHPKVSTLFYAVPFNRRLLFFSGRAQFELTMGDYLSPANAGTRQLTEFESRPTVRPTGLGNSLYFPADKGDFSAFYNYFVSGVDAQEDAVDITGHIPAYIPYGVAILRASAANNMLLTYTYAGERNSIYVYQFYQDGSQRLQSAWHRWDMGGLVQAMEVVGTTLYLAVERDGLTCAEKVELNSAFDSIRVDRKASYSGPKLTVTGAGWQAKTTAHLDYSASPTAVYWVTTHAATAQYPAGSILRGEVSPSGLEVVFAGDHAANSVTIGEAIPWSATLGRFILREESGNGSAGVSRGRTQVNRLWINHDDWGLFTVTVDQVGREPRTYKSSGRQLGTSTANIGALQPGPGRFAVPVRGRNTDVEVTISGATPQGRLC